MNLVIRKQVVNSIDHFATGERMRKWRKKLGISVRSAAKAINISAAFLSDLERGRRNWSVERHAELKSFYGRKAAK